MCKASHSTATRTSQPAVLHNTTRDTATQMMRKLSYNSRRSIVNDTLQVSIDDVVPRGTFVQLGVAYGVHCHTLERVWVTSRCLSQLVIRQAKSAVTLQATQA